MNLGDSAADRGANVGAIEPPHLFLHLGSVCRWASGARLRGARTMKRIALAVALLGSLAALVRNAADD